MIKTEISCDGCNKEIATTTNYMAEAYLELSPVYKAGESEFRWAMSGPIPIKKNYQFHNLDCISLFLSEFKAVQR